MDTQQTEPTKPDNPIRNRLTELNTKAYYLLVALSFLYRAKPAWSLKIALTLTAFVAVLPLQDYPRLKSVRSLEGVRWFKVVFLSFALAFTLFWLWCSASSS